MDGDFLQLENIDLRKLTKPQVKGYAIRSQSYEDFEVLKDNKFFDSDQLSVEGSYDENGLKEGVEKATVVARNKRHMRRDLNVEKKRQKKVKKGQTMHEDMRKRLELNSEKHPSIKSSQDFWEDIEPAVNFNAEMLDFSKELGDED